MSDAIIPNANVHNGGESQSRGEVSVLPSIDIVAEKRLLRKIDLRLLPIVFVMFIFSNLDRSNIGNAKAANMLVDLRMNSTQYSVALLVFFIGYCLGQVPSNMILSRVKPHLYLPILMALWGGVAMASAACNSFGALAGVRAILGCMEAGFSPGVLFLLSSWYRRNELAGRYCLFWLGSPTAGALGGILAGGITGSLNDVAGMAGWRWLFLIEGLATIVCAFLGYFLLPDFPDTTTWLSAEEKDLATLRLQYDNIGAAQGQHATDGAWASLKQMAHDWRTYVFVFMYMMCTGALTINYFIPTLVGALGYKGVTLQYMTVPIYATAMFFIPVICFHSDYRQERGLHLSVVGIVTGACFAGIMASTNIKAQYALLCFATAGIYVCIPLILVWTSNVVSWPAEKRAVTQATVNSMGNAASIYGAFLWPATDGPRYTPGFAATMAMLFALAAVSFAMTYLNKRFPYPQPRAALPDEAGRNLPTKHWESDHIEDFHRQK